MAYDFLKLTLRDRVAWLEYHRPPVNAFNWEMLREVPRALAELERDLGVRVIVIASGLPRYFNTGADLRVFEGMGPEAMREWVSICHSTVRIMRGSRKPLLAAINGTAVGGGLEITLHCDVRFASADARLGQPEVNISFIPPIGATQALARLLGRSRALRFLYDGALLSAEDAREIGLVDVVVPPERLREEVQAYGESLAAKPAEALAAIRRCVVEGGALPFAEGLKIEFEEAVRLAGIPDFAEGIRSFLEKRPPKWA